MLGRAAICLHYRPRTPPGRRASGSNDGRWSMMMRRLGIASASSTLACHQVHAGIGGVQRQVSLRQQLQVGHLIRLQRDLAIVRRPLPRRRSGWSGWRERAGRGQSASHTCRNPANAGSRLPETPTMNGSAWQVSRYQRLSSIQLLDSTTIAPTTPTGLRQRAIHRGQRGFVQGVDTPANPCSRRTPGGSGRTGEYARR